MTKRAPVLPHMGDRRSQQHKAATDAQGRGTRNTPFGSDGELLEFEMAANSSQNVQHSLRRKPTYIIDVGTLASDGRQGPIQADASKIEFENTSAGSTAKCKFWIS